MTTEEALAAARALICPPSMFSLLISAPVWDVLVKVALFHRCHFAAIRKAPNVHLAQQIESALLISRSFAPFNALSAD